MICTSFRDFNLHIPRRRWQLVTLRIRHQLGFQSTLSSQKVTTKTYTWAEKIGISIHTFLTEGDRSRTSRTTAVPDFNPHLPHRRWLAVGSLHTDGIAFQSTPSSQKVTCLLIDFVYPCRISIHTFLTEGDDNPLEDEVDNVKFQSTPSSQKVTAILHNNSPTPSPYH